jgi:predicted glycoside hydrolase/deacetylase ChbG (UPF0249 family)
VADDSLYSTVNKQPLLIINADDFGLTVGVNRAVEEAHRGGILTSTTVLVGGDAAEEAGDVARRCPELGIGLHVNLTHGRPLLDPAHVRTLVDRDGQLDPGLARRALFGRVDAREVYAEVAAQAERLRSFGVEPTHWDSHQGIAFWPQLIRPIAAAAAAAGITRARSHRVWALGRVASSPTTVAIRLAERASGFGLRRLATPDRRTSAALAGGWEQLFRALPATGTTEVVSHPAHVDEALAALTPTLVAERERDLAGLLDPANAAEIERRGFGLVKFSTFGL